MKAMVWRAALGITLCVAVLPGCGHTAVRSDSAGSALDSSLDAQRLVERVRARYAAVRSISVVSSARTESLPDLASLEIDDIGSGRVYFAFDAPNKIRWHCPTMDVACDGKTMWIVNKVRQTYEQVPAPVDIDIERLWNRLKADGIETPPTLAVEQWVTGGDAEPRRALSNFVALPGDAVPDPTEPGLVAVTGAMSMPYGEAATTVWIDLHRLTVSKVETDAIQSYQRIVESSTYRDFHESKAKKSGQLNAALSGSRPPAVKFTYAKRRYQLTTLTLDTPLPPSTFLFTPDPTLEPEATGVSAPR